MLFYCLCEATCDQEPCIGRGVLSVLIYCMCEAIWLRLLIYWHAGDV